MQHCAGNPCAEIRCCLDIVMLGIRMRLCGDVKRTVGVTYENKYMNVDVVLVVVTG